MDRVVSVDETPRRPRPERGRKGHTESFPDEMGTVRGHVETEDERVRSWVTSTVGASRRKSEPLTAATFET